MPVLDRLERAGEEVLLAGDEAVKTILRELWILGARFMAGFSAILLHFLYQPYYHIHRRTRILREGHTPKTGTKWFKGMSRMSSSENFKALMAEFVEFSDDEMTDKPPSPPLTHRKGGEKGDGAANGAAAKKGKSHSSSDTAEPCRRPKDRQKTAAWISLTRGWRILFGIMSLFFPRLTVRHSHKNRGPSAQPEANGINHHQTHHNHDSEHSRQDKEQMTGFFEDIELSSFMFVGHVTKVHKSLLHSFFQTVRRVLDVFQSTSGRLDTIKAASTVVWHYVIALTYYPRNILSGIGVFQLRGEVERDTMSATEQFAKSAGYPFESYRVTTEDGYILELNRLPRKGSSKAVYFQHGLLDNSVGWVATGSTGSVAFRAYEHGYDVWMGSFRGNGSKGHQQADIDSDTYWDFTVNEHAVVDLRTFVEYVRKTKEAELEDTDEDIKVTAVGHSMGAAAMMMYLTHSGYYKLNHHLDQAIVLSPAGVHLHVSPFLKGLVTMVDRTAAKWFNCFHVPFDTLHLIGSKMLQDVRKSPETLDLLTWVFSMVLGGEMKGSFLRHVDFFTYRFYGISSKVFSHGFQCFSRGRFEMFDFGPEENLKRYGSEKPLNVCDNYDKIDIPVYIAFGDKDKVIQPQDVIYHHDALSKHHPDLAHLKRFPDLGHVDFTVGMSDDIINYVVKVLESA